MTGLLHRDPAGDPFEHKLRLSYLRYVTSSKPAATTLAENYVGFEPPFPAFATRGRERWKVRGSKKE
jgi:p-hydroxybenzoate 3-monooxygenase